MKRRRPSRRPGLAATALSVLLTGLVPAQETRSLDVIRVDQARHGRITWCMSPVATAFNMLDQPWKWGRPPAPGTATSRPYAAAAPESSPASRIAVTQEALDAHGRLVPVNEPFRFQLQSALYSGRDLDAAIAKAVADRGIQDSDSAAEREVIRQWIEPARRTNEDNRRATSKSLERVLSDEVGGFVDDVADTLQVHDPLDIRIIVVPSDDLQRVFIGHESIVVSGPPVICDGVLLRAALAIQVGSLVDVFGPNPPTWQDKTPRPSYLLAAAALQFAARGWVFDGTDALEAAAARDRGDTLKQLAAIQLFRFALGIRPVFDDVAIRRIKLADALVAARHVWRGLYAVGYVHGNPDAEDITAGWLPAAWDVRGRLSRAVRATTRKESYVVGQAGAVDLASDGDWTVDYGQTEGKAPNSVAALRLSEWIRDRLWLLPPELLARMSLHRIVICSRLAVDGQKLSAAVLYSKRQLAYDVDLLTEGDFARHSFYHEFFHLLDWEQRGGFDPDAEWAALNAPGTSYGKGGSESRGATRAATTGFVSWYAQSAVEEDKAETFAALMSSPAAMSKRIASEPIIAAKVALLKKRLSIFCLQCDEAWWARVGEAAVQPR